ncbi:MAG: hypothetical protein NUV93_07505 [Firmicutes bacterium]|nr:hypothetical protein [Bacillota bacterium]
MRIAALVSALWREHFRSTVVVLETLAVALFVGIVLDPRVSHEWDYVALALNPAIVVLAAVSTGFIIGRNADEKMDILVLKAGKVRYYLAVVIVAILVTTFWMTVIGAYIHLAIRLPNPVTPGAPGRLVLSLGGSMLVVVSLFVLFSTLTGRPIEPIVAVILLVLSLGSFETEPWRRLTVLLPPLVENARAAIGLGQPQWLRCLAYSAVVLSLGLARFLRREFIWS